MTAENHKGSLSVEHPIAGDELRAIKRYLATRTDKLPWLFVSERASPRCRVLYLPANRRTLSIGPSCRADARDCVDNTASVSGWCARVKLAASKLNASGTDEFK